jgi:hypothetical protein
MIKLENTVVYGWEAAIRGMRNPMNSWDKSDSKGNVIGENDLELMKKLVKAGSDHSKFMRMINVSIDIVAPLYWWAEYDTYKVGTVRNSCSKMHKIHDKTFTLEDFSTEQLNTISENMIKNIIDVLNVNRDLFIETRDKFYWWQMIQLLPSSYNQRSTVQLNYAVLRNMYHSRKAHKLDEWRAFCKWIEELPYSELITLT